MPRVRACDPAPPSELPPTRPTTPGPSRLSLTTGLSRSLFQVLSALIRDHFPHSIAATKVKICTRHISWLPDPYTFILVFMK